MKAANPLFTRVTASFFLIIHLLRLHHNKDRHIYKAYFAVKVRIKQLICGIALGGTMGTLLTGCSQKQPAAVASPGPAPVPSAPEFPWTYQKLDVKECQEERIKTTWQGAEALVPPKVFSA
jgi:hypothetical protein